VLREEKGRVERAAARLGIPRSSLYQKIKKYNLNTSRV
jgi:transcriptional regulator of acetoin/glycerol metabolism